MSTDKWCFKQTANLLSLGTHVRSSFARSSIRLRDCREADSRDTSPRHACLSEVSRKIWLHDFFINNNGGSVPVIFISLPKPQCSSLPTHCNQTPKTTFGITSIRRTTKWVSLNKELLEQKMHAKSITIFIFQFTLFISLYEHYHKYFLKTWGVGDSA